MDSDISPKEFSLMQKYIEDRIGITLGEDKIYLLKSRLSRLLKELHMSDFELLYFELVSGKNPKIEEKVIDAITTNETFWFRDKAPWSILESILLPLYINEIRTGCRSKVRIWSAACSTGQEPYSIAMCIDNYLSYHNISDVHLSQFEIVATDISRTVLQKAEGGIYDAISMMRGLEERYRSRYFTNEGKVWKINDVIRDSVAFEQFNLKNSMTNMDKYDIVFCRYVLIYFSDELKRELIRKLSMVMEANGVLFIGASEIFPGGYSYFTAVQYDAGMYFKAKG